jgi:phage tail sheath protein FI
VGDGASARSASQDSGTAFLVGLTDRGPINAPVLVRSLSEAVSKLGARVSYGMLYDSLETFFREGGSAAYVGRIVGPTPVTSTLNLSDGSSNTLTVKAISPGAWGNNLAVQVAAGSAGGTFVLTVRESGTVVEVSPDLADNVEALAWATKSAYITLTNLGGGDPAVAASASLTTGADDRANITATQVQNALNLFTADLGPGQVAYPGATDGPSHLALAAHAAARNRVAILDGTDTATASTITAQAAAVRADGNGRSAAVFAPWAKIPGLTPGTERTVPYSAVQCGLIARSDGATGNPNVAVAADNGTARYATGLSQPAWSDANRETLNDGGVNVALIKNGEVKTYGNRTCANQVLESNWLQLANARLAMYIASKAEAIAESYLFSQLDGRGIKVAEFAGDLQGMLLPLFQLGALFGETAEDAFSVDTGEGVNPPASLADGILSASISVRMSPAAERVEINITKVAAKETI